MYDLNIIDDPKEGHYDAIIVATAHQQFIEMGSEAIRKFGKDKSIIFDVKSIFVGHETDGRL